MITVRDLSEMTHMPIEVVDCQPWDNEERIIFSDELYRKNMFRESAWYWLQVSNREALRFSTRYDDNWNENFLRIEIEYDPKFEILENL